MLKLMIWIACCWIPGALLLWGLMRFATRAPLIDGNPTKETDDVH